MKPLVKFDDEHDRLAALSGRTADVPCNGCTLCCQGGDLLRLLPTDDATKYKTEPHPLKPGALMLAHKPNGDCWYLGERGCTIHGDTPLLCRRMDCRTIAKAVTFTKARTTPGINLLVWQRGKQLLREGK